jgi:hypothetical protein
MSLRTQTDDGLKSHHDQLWNALSEDLRARIVARPRESLHAEDLPAIRADIARAPLNWWVPHHLHFGMGCDEPASLRYPAMEGGYMHLCLDHGAKHAPYCERWTHRGWVESGELLRELTARRNEGARGYQAGYHAGRQSKEAVRS